jgi:hypothetical protein
VQYAVKQLLASAFITAARERIAWNGHVCGLPPAE